jgi:Na+-translocating ferredoxin:NAD+ oxidoreductase RnfC subunit
MVFFSLTHADGDPAANLSQTQLMQLNRASQQELRNIQGQPFGTGKAESGQQQSATRQLNRQQDLEQQALQERQRKDLLMQNARARTTKSPGLAPSLQAIQRQQQYRHQQRGQLNRFRVQQGRYR